MKANFNIWWHKLGDAEQQRLANKYHPKDDFIVTGESNYRIKQIYLKENENNRKYSRFYSN